MIIRSEQMSAFEEAARRGFERDLARRCADSAPTLCERAGGDNVLRFVKLGIDRAGSHGFSLRGPVRLYVDLMLWFGCDFDSDPQLDWARQALALGTEEDELERAKALYQAAQPYTERVAGSQGEHALAATERLSRMTESGCPKLSGAFEDELMRLLRTLYPEKFEYARAAAVRPLIQRAAQTAAGFGVRLGMAVTLLTTLMFIFGHGVAEDPMYPWIAAALGDPDTPNPHDRAANLCNNVVKLAGRPQPDLELQPA
jgi:hypothetical protein